MSGSSHFRAAHAGDVLRACIPFLKLPERKRAELALAAFDQGKSSVDDVVSSALLAARCAWSARQAVRRMFQKEADQEFELITNTLRPSSAHLLKRLRQSIPGTLDDVLTHTDTSIAFGADDLQEIQEIRTHVQEHAYTTDPKKFAVEMKQCERERNALEEKLDDWRDLGNLMRGSLQDQALSRLNHVTEQWLLFDHIPTLETLTQEIQYVREQKELNPFTE